MKIHSKQGNQPNPHIVWHQKCEISIKIPLMTAKKCKISSSSSPNLGKNWNLGSGPNVVLALESFTYYVSNVYVPRVRANADQVLTTPPRVSRDPKKCWRNMWMAPNMTWYVGFWSLRQSSAKIVIIWSTLHPDYLKLCWQAFKTRQSLRSLISCNVWRK